MIRKHAKKISGFTLIELLIVVTIIGIIVAFGYPVYTNKVIETRRTDAKSALTKLANLQEKIFTECNRYASGLVDTITGSSCAGAGGATLIAWDVPARMATPTTGLSADGHYQITIMARTAGNAGPTATCTAVAGNCFLLQANPTGVGASGLQVRNGVSDGNLRLDQAGRKSWNRGNAAVFDANNTGMYVDGGGNIIQWTAK